jgi:outer membrane receptor protein involved in Fe transport
MRFSVYLQSLLPRWSSVVALFLVVGAAPVMAQEQQPPAETPDSAEVKPTVSYRISPVVVTATRTEKNQFDVPKPVSVLTEAEIRERTPNNPADLLRDLPGVDVTGVGVNQVRPSIRGQRGQRILLLQDGMRLSNSRRQQSFGEIPGLVDVSSLERIEIVRGPASVLYGTDAIGGVINMITLRPTDEGLHGSGSYRYSSQDGQHRGVGSVNGRFGSWLFRAKGSYRAAKDYRAPSGSFGQITLDSNTTVFDTGTNDYSIEGYLGYQVSRSSEVYAKYERYHADTAGFGYVDPGSYAPDAPFIQIIYPFQTFGRLLPGQPASVVQQRLRVLWNPECS